jgi:hypothetical protein
MSYHMSWFMYLVPWGPGGLLQTKEISRISERPCILVFRVRVRAAFRLEVYRQSFRLCDNPLRLTTSNFIFQLNTCGYSPYVTSSLTRGWVWRLQLLLGLASTVILRFESRRIHDHILLSQIRNSPNLEGQVPIFISPSNRVVRSYPQALGSPFVASNDRLHTGVKLGPVKRCLFVNSVLPTQCFLVHCRPWEPRQTCTVADAGLIQL